MSKTQKWFLAIGLLLMALAALFPPTCYVRNGKMVSPRGFLYCGNLNDMNFERLVVEWVFIAAMTGLFMVLNKSIGKMCTQWIYECRHANDVEVSKNKNGNE